MKVICKYLSCCLLLTAFSCRLQAQDQEIQQLLLNVEKLSQFKAILQDMKTGYTVLSQGYNTVKDISQGNFNLHQVFLDGLLKVSPVVRNYVRIAEIVRSQQQLVAAYQAAYRRFSSSGNFRPAELDYLAKVYAQLRSESLANLDELLTVTTASQLRMSDAERLDAIDRLYAGMQDKLNFLRHFNDEAAILNNQRQRERQDLQRLKNLY